MLLCRQVTFSLSQLFQVLLYHNDAAQEINVGLLLTIIYRSILFSINHLVYCISDNSEKSLAQFVKSKGDVF